jgi:hypothetical protein
MLSACATLFHFLFIGNAARHIPYLFNRNQSFKDVRAKTCTFLAPRKHMCNVHI